MQDSISAVLKGHLFCEELLDQIIIAHCRDPLPLQKIQLQFNAKLKIASAIYGNHLPDIKLPDNKIWDAIDRLNKLRNELAHKIEGKEVINKAREMIISANRLDKGNKISTKDICSADEAIVEIKRAISKIIGYLDAMKAVSLLNKPDSSERRILIAMALNIDPSQVARALSVLVLPEKKEISE
ncbi:hypothetical protein IB274_06095 [Pseudomonas sp. PDM18]|uniref:hypothetical protein n=1 Tax=Pseudomonas sp. PDM18 TaxID=2769253 RepID=UPI001785BCC2|nr:hypothetical protein [Pseudomonas sp. PDM18]MBD9676263.1 hypothetical protein [Pseudomonas sp. PDM18]